jgi:3'-phosphoadenosine 5'-phosphosulfate sulfotransferase (PAPS reductase)/FAD synthetase
VFFDTGWEHPALYDYLRGELSRAIGPIVEVRSSRYPGGMVDLIRQRHSFPSRLRRLCTDELKVRPARAYIERAQDTYGEVINAVGIRAEESKARALMPEWEWSEALDCESWRPLITWTVADVVAIHARHGLRPNPLYLAGAERVGCWPCIFSRKAEVRMVADLSPGRMDMIRELEKELSEHAGSPRTFFAGRSTREGVQPIDSVIAWSRTPTRGVEPEPFDDPNRGCMRWGLCETVGGTGRAPAKEG